MKFLIILSTSIFTLFCSCSTINPNQNGNGSQGSNLTDIDGNTYHTSIFCGQTWMAKNLNVSHYRNGDIIPQVTDMSQWLQLNTGAWCWYNNDSVNYSQYGKLYNWYAVNDSRGLAPLNFHVSTNSEWDLLNNCLGLANSGGDLKETGFSHWLSPNTGATNKTGFTGLPGGYLSSFSGFFGIGGCAYWWTSTAYGSSKAYLRSLQFNAGIIFNSMDYFIAGFSVRCVKD